MADINTNKQTLAAGVLTTPAAATWSWNGVGVADITALPNGVYRVTLINPRDFSECDIEVSAFDTVAVPNVGGVTSYLPGPNGAYIDFLTERAAGGLGNIGFSFRIKDRAATGGAFPVTI